MTKEDTYNTLKQELLDIISSLSDLLGTLSERPDITEERFIEWQRACDDIRRLINEEVVRIAVIGAVKSGKSTFVNSLFRGDYVKRGAGVMTSIVTRIRSGEDLKAVLFFKSWDEINSEIENALFMLPSWENREDDKPFDLRRVKDRSALQSAIDRLSDDLLITDGTRNTDSVLLSLYLSGYDRVSKVITSESMTTEFSGKKFGEHRTFVADDALAVYLKDVELEINDDNMDRAIEIADCQGSDSPNPLHLAMIQDYLLKTHFIVYVISSRTGLRQADVKFLSIIKKMGILGNILFIVNSDFNEHESKNELVSLVNKVKEELAMIRPEPEVFTISALFNLFGAISGDLKQKDKLRLKYWKAEKDLTEFSEKETSRFEAALNRKLTRERFGLLLSNQLERMDVMASGIENWVMVNKELLEKDVEEARGLIERMDHLYKRMEDIKSLIRSTFKGATADIMKGLRSDIDRFFNIHTGSVLERTIGFVNEYSGSVERYREKLAASGFSNTLYLVFQEFRQSLDLFMAEEINPDVARFSGEIEGRVKKALESVAGPYYSMASDNVADLKAVIGNSTAKAASGAGEGQILLDLDTLKRVAGLKLPSSTANLQYYSRVRAETVVRLGLYSIKKLFRKALKKPLEDEKEGEMRALSDGVRLIKRETEKSIVFHFENYRENFKFQYVSRLLDASAENLHQLLVERFQSYSTDIQSMEKTVEKKGGEREEMVEFLGRVNDDIQRMQESISSTRKAVEKVD